MKKSRNIPFKQIPGGEYDEYGFYYSPDGSFWDPDGVYFNSYGYDSHGGYYSNNFEYIPGPGWVDELLCYEDEKKELMKNMKLNGRKSDSNNLPFSDLTSAFPYPFSKARFMASVARV